MAPGEDDTAASQVDGSLAARRSAALVAAAHREPDPRQPRSLNMVLGGGGTAVIGMIPFGIVTGVVLLIARSRLHDDRT